MTNAPLEDGLAMPRRAIAVIGLSTVVALTVLDATIANVALPTLAVELNTTASESVWVVNAYQLATVMALLPLGALGERLGHAKVFRLGLALFVLASLACALSRSLDLLIAARVVQGFGAAAAMTCSPALMRYTYPRAIFGKGIALNTVVVTVSAAAGPTLGALILSFASWPWLFLVNVPLGIAAFVLTRALPATGTQPRKFDFPSIALNAVALASTIIGLDLLAKHGGWAVGVIALAVVSWTVFIKRSIRQATPLLPIDLFRIPRFRLSVFASVVMFCAQMLCFVALPFHFLHFFSRTTVQTGLLMSAWPIAAGITTVIAAKFFSDARPTLQCAIGASILLVGIVALALMTPSASNLLLVVGMLIAGVGYGFFQAPSNREMLSIPPRERSGAAGGVLAIARMGGLTLGASIAGLCLAFSGVSGAHYALAAAACFAGVAIVVNATRDRLAKLAAVGALSS